MRLKFLVPGLLLPVLSQALTLEVNQTEIMIFSDTPGRYAVSSETGYHDTCISNPEKGRNLAFCYFRNPQSVGVHNLNINRVNYRVFVNKTPLYPIDKLVDIRKDRYRVKLDQNTGTIYELYNANNDLNLVHSHIGAAIQVAFHQGKPNTFESCTNSGMGGYFNPTQAGAICGYPDGHLLFPAGSETKMVYSSDRDQIYDWENLNLYNFDYGRTYPGPYNNGDQYFLSSKLTAKKNFFEIEYTHRLDTTKGVGVIQAPTIYFHRFLNNFEYQVFGKKYKRIIPQHAWNSVERMPYEYDWAALNSSNNGFVFLSVPSSELTQKLLLYPDQTPNVSLTQGYERVNLSLNYVLRFDQGVPYRNWFLAVPGKPNDMIDSPFGRQTVSEFMVSAKQYYKEYNQSLRYAFSSSVTPPESPGLKFDNSRANTALWSANNAIDRDPNTCYSSVMNDKKAWIAMWLPQLTNVSEIELTPRKVNGQVVSFAPAHRVYVTAPDNSRWDYVGRTSRTIQVNKSTYGVLVVPESLGLDDYKNPFFQLCEVVVR